MKRDALRHAGLGLVMGLALGLALVLALGWSPGVLACAGLALGAYLGVASRWLDEHAPHTRIGAANRVTLLRAALVANLTWLLVEPWRLELHGWALTGLMVLALVLDGLDGWTARRFGNASGFGARFDQELDALFVALLAAILWRTQRAGAWILLAGAWHYLFRVWLALRPGWRIPLPPSRRRRVVCVVTSSTLVGCLSPLFTPVSGALAVLALGLVSASFGADLLWLRREVVRDLTARESKNRPGRGPSQNAGPTAHSLP